MKKKELKPEKIYKQDMKAEKDFFTKQKIEYKEEANYSNKKLKVLVAIGVTAMLISTYIFLKDNAANDEYMYKVPEGYELVNEEGLITDGQKTIKQTINATAITNEDGRTVYIAPPGFELNEDKVTASRITKTK